LLTGGDPSADPDDEGTEIEGVAEPGQHAHFVTLPDEMRHAIRVDIRANRNSR
jgi:hypothetical protein